MAFGIPKAAPLPAPIRVSRRAAGTVPYEMLMIADSFRGSWTGTIQVDDAADGRLRERVLLSELVIETRGRIARFPMRVVTEQIVERDGSPWSLKAPVIESPDRSPVPGISDSSWLEIRKGLVDTFDTKNTLMTCVSSPIFPSDAIQVGDYVTARDKLDHIRRSLRCGLAAARGGLMKPDADVLSDFNRIQSLDARSLDAEIEEVARRNIASSPYEAFQYQSNIIVRGLVREEDRDFITIAGTHSIRAADSSGTGQLSLLIDPHTGLIYKMMIMLSAEGMAAKPGTTRQAVYFADLPRRVAPPAPRTAVPPSTAGRLEASPPITSPRTATPPRSPHPSGSPPLGPQTALPPLPPSAEITPVRKPLVRIYNSSIGSIFTVLSGDSAGTGFLVAPDIVVTNAHVAGTSDRAEIWRKGVRLGEGRVIVRDDAHDIAFIRANVRLGAMPLPLARHDPEIGTEILVIGSPRGLEGTLTAGIVSNVHHLSGGTFLQIDAAVNPGNSGGPVIDLDGQVVGIATARLKDTQGINFAVSSRTIAELYQDRVGSRRLGPRIANAWYSNSGPDGSTF